MDIRFRGNVLTKLSRGSALRRLVANVRRIDLGGGRERGRRRQRQKEREGGHGTRRGGGKGRTRITAPRDRAFNYCTARTNLRASGHRCRTPENQFRGRHIQSTREEGCRSNRAGVPFDSFPKGLGRFPRSLFSPLPLPSSFLTFFKNKRSARVIGRNNARRES